MVRAQHSNTVVPRFRHVFHLLMVIIRLSNGCSDRISDHEATARAPLPHHTRAPRHASCLPALCNPCTRSVCMTASFRPQRLALAAPDSVAGDGRWADRPLVDAKASALRGQLTQIGYRPAVVLGQGSLLLSHSSAFFTSERRRRRDRLMASWTNPASSIRGSAPPAKRRERPTLWWATNATPAFRPLQPGMFSWSPSAAGGLARAAGGVRPGRACSSLACRRGEISWCNLALRFIHACPVERKIIPTDALLRLCTARLMTPYWHGNFPPLRASPNGTDQQIARGYPPRLVFALLAQPLRSVLHCASTHGTARHP